MVVDVYMSVPDAHMIQEICARNTIYYINYTQHCILRTWSGCCICARHHLTTFRCFSLSINDLAEGLAIVLCKTLDVVARIKSKKVIEKTLALWYTDHTLALNPFPI